jgi:tetratricopeptide (TPR) repeat protein
MVLVAALASSPGAARADSEDCFGEVSSRRIEACSEILAMPDLEPHMRALAYASRALGYSLREQYDTAIRDYDTSLRINPSSAVALNNRAWAYFKKGEPTKGLPDVEQALALEPTSPHAYDTRAHIRQWLGQPREALADYERAMRFDDRLTKLYQCGLQNHGLYSGRIDGRWSHELQRGLETCVQSTACDPLPPDEECKPATS